MEKKTAQTMAKWWADQLRNGAKLDNGDDSPTGVMTMALGLMSQAAEREKQSPELIEQFEERLADLLLAEKNFWSIGVDYHPDHLLQQAAEKAGLELGMTSLPWKTHMRVVEDKVFVSCGYRAEEVEVK